MRFWSIIALILVLSAVGLTYEIAAGRVLAPFFGTSLLTWTAVIAVVLAGFSIGSAAGGLVAERERGAALRTSRGALIAAAMLMALSPTVLGLLYASGARGTGGMLLAVTVAFLPASVAITLPSPLLARMAVEARPGREGSSLGLVLAAGSVGAIVGAVTAGFALLPLAGSAATFAGCGAAALLSCLALRGGGGAPLWPAALVVGASVLAGPVCRYESGLSCIDVARAGGAVSLYSDRVWQAADPPGLGEGPRELVVPYTRVIWARMERDLAPDASVLFIGGGGYTLPAQLLAARPEARAVAVEIDPLVTRVVREELPWAGAIVAREAGGRLDIVHADGRAYLNETPRRFDAAVMDAFSSDSVPAHLVTRETYERLAEIVSGPVYVNLIDAPDGPLARGVHAILSGIWPHVTTLQGPISPRGRTNAVMIASPAPLDPGAPIPEGYAPVPITPARAFTDDRGWVGHR